jgi:hypothetical protein
LGDLATPLRDLAQLADTRPTLGVRLGPKSLRQRGRRVAIDLLAWPSHGTVDEGHQDAVRHGQATHGTPHFFPSATASVILRGRRYTLALYRVRTSLTMEQVVERLQQRLDALAIQVSVLWLACGFYSGKVLRALME